MLLQAKTTLSRRALLQAFPLLSLQTKPWSSESALKRKEYTLYLVADNDSKPIVGTPKAPKFAHFTSSLMQLTINAEESGFLSGIEWGSAPRYTMSTSPPQSVPLITGYSYGGRGAELSDLLSTGAPDWKLYTFDDRTGIVFEVLATTETGQTRPAGSSLWESWHERYMQGVPPSGVFLVPRWICSDGAGDLPEEATSVNVLCHPCRSAMKDGKIVIGSHGYEVWRSPPYFPGLGMRNVQYIKELCPRTGMLQHIDWSAFYNSLSQAAGVVPNSGGYLTHEAAAWSSIHNRWYFMPRRFSKDEPWDPNKDANRGCNLIISAQEMPSGGPPQNVEVVQIQAASHPTRGYSAMRFLPDSDDRHIVALKTVETNDGGNNMSYITVVTIDGQVLLPETLISTDQKLEGLEIAGAQ
ncbi:apyrase [Dunaliella salina]|uniref:Apyrase n=1 Tax=Dunaliella salina TaxID=3046 RepID=A0ABQ7H583_DUNSA|nr:apyrase [Dunaliella salina]|eukprot:KAF5842006.1 apyrase [Dunaliella salina]